MRARLLAQEERRRARPKLDDLDREQQRRDGVELDDARQRQVLVAQRERGRERQALGQRDVQRADPIEAEALGDQEGIASALGRVSDALYGQGKAKEALEYARQGIAICQKNGFKQEAAGVLQSAAYACMALGDYEQALSYSDQSLELARSLNMGQSILADQYNTRGNALKRLGRYREALVDYKACLDVSEKISYAGGTDAAIANLGEINLLMGNYAAALPYQLKTIEGMEASGDIHNLVENYVHVSNIYEQLNDYKSALVYQRKALKMRDSTASIQSDAAVSDLRLQYETEQKEATIAGQTAKLAQQRTVQWLSMGIAALLGLFAFSFLSPRPGP